MGLACARRLASRGELPISASDGDRPDATAAGPLVAGGGSARGFGKVGVRILCRRQVLEWAGRGARLVSLSPGVIDTAMGRRAMGESPDLPDRVGRSPFRRLGRPDEVAAVV